MLFSGMGMGLRGGLYGGMYGMGLADPAMVGLQTVVSHHSVGMTAPGSEGTPAERNALTAALDKEAKAVAAGLKKKK
jgi:hypothetical protein